MPLISSMGAYPGALDGRFCVKQSLGPFLLRLPRPSVLTVLGSARLQVAAEYAGQLVFVTVNTDKKDGEPVLNFFGVKPDSEFPVV